MGGVKVEVESSTGRHVDLCDAYGAPIPLACRVASCGTCRIHVLEGAGDLLPADVDELELLHVFDAEPPHVRLACQAKLRTGATRLRVKAFHDE
jgi:ferredoxin